MLRQIYLDYCATTPVHPQVRAAMLETLDETFGNPSSMHQVGSKAAQLVKQARARVAQGIGCKPGEIYFTSGATEADNLALLGVLRSRLPQRSHLITSAIEHHAILHTAQQLEREGFPVTYLTTDSHGLVDPEDVRKAIRPDTGLISIMMVNNEIGSIQPIAEIGAIARQEGILMHTDAVQGVGLLEVDVEQLHVDLLSLSAHKIYGPKGIGALYVRDGTRFSPLMYGGPHEGGKRPGTENMPGIAGLGAAMQVVLAHKDEERLRLKKLRQQLIEDLQGLITNIIVNGPTTAVAPHVLSVSFKRADAEAMLLRLNMLGIATSMGSACTSKDIEPSHVLTAMGLSREQIEGTLRLSFGFPTTRGEIDSFLEMIPDVYAKARLD
jgi:cysteine desulfurase